MNRFSKRALAALKRRKLAPQKQSKPGRPQGGKFNFSRWSRSRGARERLSGKDRSDHPSRRLRPAHHQPHLLHQLEETEGEVKRRLSVEAARAYDAKQIHPEEKTFRWMHNEDAMAVEKLSEGIRKFYADT